MKEEKKQINKKYVMITKKSHKIFKVYSAQFGKTLSETIEYASSFLEREIDEQEQQKR